jgi:cyclophilin family peptidyl-prolyl cis-trans isomerase
MKIILNLSLSALLLFSTIGNSAPTVKFETTAGNFVIELNADKAPVTVENFLNYVNSGFYEGIIFHRVIADFMIQVGGYNEDFGQKEPDQPIVNEGGNGLLNNLGTVAMARTSMPDSATSQFFINVKDNSFLNYQDENNPGYAVFGKVSQGMDMLLELSQRPTGPGGIFPSDVPVTPVVILKTSVIENK